MPAIINSSPECVTNVEGAKPADDAADFIIQANYQDCAGFMTFGPGTTYGEGGTSAATSYYVLTWLGIAVMVLVFVAWIVYREPAADCLRREQRAEPRHRTATTARNTITGRQRMSRQIEFPPNQTHKKSFEMAMLAFSIICAIVVLVIVLFTNIGNEFRPTV